MVQRCRVHKLRNVPDYTYTASSYAIQSIIIEPLLRREMATSETNILVTGGCGYKGTVLIPKLLAARLQGPSARYDVVRKFS